MKIVEPEVDTNNLVPLNYLAHGSVFLCEDSYHIIANPEDNGAVNISNIMKDEVLCFNLDDYTLELFKGNMKVRQVGAELHVDVSR